MKISCGASSMAAVLLTASVSFCGEPGSIEAIVGGLEPASAYRAQLRETLRGFPEPDVVSVILEHLETDPRFHDRTLRSIAYGLLDDFHAEKTPEGLAQLLTGLKEHGYGANALGRLGSNPPPGVVEALGNRLVTGPSDGQDPVVRSLGAYKELSLPYFDAVAAVLERKDLEYPSRFTAAKALVAIGGIEKALEKFRNDDADAATEKIVLNAVGYWGLQTWGTYNADESVRQTLKRRTLSGLKHPDRDVRNAAMEATFVGPYNMEIAVKGADGRWTLNPEVAEALRYMATNDPDEKLRAKALLGLNDDYTRLGEKIERNRKKMEKPVPATQP